MTLARKIVLWFLAIFLVLVAILVVVIATFDWNRLKPTINDKVSEQLGRPFAINGNLAVRWAREPDEPGLRAGVPWPHVSAEDITLANPDWAKNPQMVGLQRVEMSLSPVPLLWRTVTIPRIDLTGPGANLERLADGRNSWTFTLKPSDPDEPPSESPWTLVEANDKNFARVKILRTLCHRLEAALQGKSPSAPMGGADKAEKSPPNKRK